MKELIMNGHGPASYWLGLQRGETSENFFILSTFTFQLLLFQVTHTEYFFKTGTMKLLYLILIFFNRKPETSKNNPVNQ